MKGNDPDDKEKTGSDSSIPGESGNKTASPKTEFFGMKKERIIFRDFLRSESGCLVINGPAGAGKNTLVEIATNKYLHAGRAVLGMTRPKNVGVGIEPLLESLADLITNLITGVPDEDMNKRRKVLVASSRKIRKGEREATILLLHEIHSRLRTDLGNDFDPKFFEFLNIQPKDEEGILLTLPELNDYLSDNLQLFLNAYVHLIENMAGFLKRWKMHLIFIYPRAQYLQQTALAHVANLVSRMSSNIYFILTFDSDADPENTRQKINFAARMGNTKIIEMNGLDAGGIEKWLSARTGRKISDREVLHLKEITEGLPFYLGFLIEALGASDMEGEKDGVKRYGSYMRKKIEEKGKNSTRFLEEYSLVDRPMDLREMTVIFPFSGEEISEMLKLMEGMNILDENGDFLHPLTRKHIADSIDNSRKKAYHDHLARYYEDRFRSDTESERKFDFKTIWAISHHYFHSDDREKSYSYNTFMAREGLLSSTLDVARLGYERALSDAVMLENEAYRISVLEKLVKVLEKELRWDRALELHKMLVDHFSSAGDTDNKCIALQRIAAIYQFKADFDNSLGYYTRALKIFQKEENREQIAATYMNMGTLYQIKEDLEDALKNYMEAFKIYRELKNKLMVATLRHKIASVYHLDYKYTKALEHYNKSLAIFKEIEDKKGYGETLHQMANIHFLRDKYDMAAKYYRKSLTVLKETDSRKGVAEVHYQMGVLAGKENKYQEALESFNDSLNIFREIEDIANIANTIRTLGDAYIEIAKKQIGGNKIKTARETLGGAVKIFSQVGDKDGIEEANFLLEDVAEIESGVKTAKEIKDSWG